MLKLLIKVGVSALALMMAALSVAACVLPGAGMTSAERECCKKMAEQCGDMGMAKSHLCCQPTGSSTDFHALKASSSCQDHLTLGGSSGTTDLGASRHMPFADTNGVSGFLHA